MEDHKLCGYLCVVLRVNAPPLRDLHIPFGTNCEFFSDGGEIGFGTEGDVVLSPIEPKSKARQLANGLISPEQENAESVPVKSRKGKGRSRRESSRKRVRGIGLLHGSVSVVHQLQALAMHKCLKIVARILGVYVRDDNVDARAVVLVDVYLPISLWSGWQFPRSRSIAGAFFRHLRCDWKERSMSLVGGEYLREAHEDRKSIWNVSDCHVLECKLHCDAQDSSKKGLFELNEIFKSLPSVGNKENPESCRLIAADVCCGSGIWDIAGDILVNILSLLRPLDLIRVAGTCRYMRLLAASIMPCMKLKLFPHQQAAIEWMLQREQNVEVLQHPLYLGFSTEDGFTFYVNTVSGDVVPDAAPTIRDFRGGMFCDEPGLGKTITALSLILKTQGMMADPPKGVQVIWCTHNGDHRCGYYELSGNSFLCNDSSLRKRLVSQNTRRGKLYLDEFTRMDDLNCSPKRARLIDLGEQIEGSCAVNKMKSPLVPQSELKLNIEHSLSSLSSIKRNLYHSFFREEVVGEKLIKRKRGSNGSIHVSEQQVGKVSGVSHSHKSIEKATIGTFVYNENWVQCDYCHKWRKLADASVVDSTQAWFCSMNNDPMHQSCGDPEEAWDRQELVTCLLGFYTRGTSGGKEQNISFFISVLKEHYTTMNSTTKKALRWLANLTEDKLSRMETSGLESPILGTCLNYIQGFHSLFQAFGLMKRVEKGVSRWYYPQRIDSLVFDVAALRIALCEPLDSVRLYLSRATLIVVPSNLVDHWKTQIQRHVRPDQLRLCVWTDHKKPSAHSLAWNYDIVITTFSRLSAEWGAHKQSPLMQVHWHRVMLDEGHTLGSSLNLTNKLQMAISLTASNRWLLTGTPTPSMPNSQLSHLQPLLKFLHDEVYGDDQKSWEAGILKPFESEREEGRSRLLQLLHRCMISARKTDLQTIPPCIKKVTFLNFTEEHARSYNELVETVRRNILMADWNDPSHVESLLNPKQWKFRSATIRNVRKSCCVAGHIKVTDAGQDIQETMDMLFENGLDPLSEEYALIKYYLLSGGECARCKEGCRLPIITPCRHLLCLDCVALDGERCTLPGCGFLYEMQSPETSSRPENPNPKWPVPKDLIELQPSYKQDDWNPDWQSTSSSKVTYLVEKLKALQQANREMGFSINEDNCTNHIDKLNSPSELNNASALLQQEYSRLQTDSYKGLPAKVLVFSQFLEHIHVIEEQLTVGGIRFAGMYSPMHSYNKIKSLATFQHDESCMALLMDGSAALGLDLSFVTHVFLMEPIWDRSMEEQVISRAHRMGATRPIQVETLAMCGTIEEQMVGFLQDANECRRLLKEEFGKPDNEGARTRRTLHDFAESNYLAHLSFVRTNSKS
ncbi:hypothetical protein HS088_TW09G00498 [Tripterygium wilfordii]|uniref:F-box protein n=1 Tax=Tripterygium wilfordii TaxID=458696 RepID=A0A7J7D7V4_TRIWF|nr:F-box protein At3g54460 [Tripterygium wilfordii]KAF5742450.1 hypothetical protein HS088_TW09G00498 [Tripterygium wilfordii]